ncbi:MAG: hypothetical protein Q8Q25_00815, partial [bacterium]|nr:hypothetical protein [bacterium]
MNINILNMRLTRLSFSFLLATMVLATPLASTHAATSMASNLKGRILLQVEGHGEAWYVNPANQKRYYLGRPDDAFKVMRTLGVGITNENLLKIEEEGGIPNNEFVDKNFSRLHAG